MTNKYYLKKNNLAVDPFPTRTGPFTDEELENFYRAGQIDGDILCWPDKFFSFGWKPLLDFFPRFRSRGGDTEQKRPDHDHQADETEERGEREQKDIRTASFDCVECGSRLRFRLKPGIATYRCPACKSEYKTVQADGEPPVMLVMPASHQRTKSSEGSEKRKRSLPSEVRAALLILALEEDATFDQVRQTYHKAVKQYHPDRVAHLGPELRKMADLKTKEIISAYKVLEKFYSS
jgi:DnaJ-domain-containing protein 1